ncbi:MAG: hypothetical protein VKK62_03645 [Synechococcaceae cyanobacterium]|nr:hypothetical protein [Synechococcaceae cyanobacterium]
MTSAGRPPTPAPCRPSARGGDLRQRGPGPRRRRACRRGPLLLLTTLLAGLCLAPAATADGSLARCNAWQRSSGVARILLGNAIGAAHYLTKRVRLQESPPDHPVALYHDSDIQRVCSWR